MLLTQEVTNLNVQKILRENIYPHSARQAQIWNTPPGSFFFDPKYSGNVCDYPFEEWHLRPHQSSKTSYCSESPKHNQKPVLVVTCDQLSKNRISLLNKYKELFEKIFIVNCNHIKDDHSEQIEPLKLENYKTMSNVWRFLMKKYLKESVNCFVLGSDALIQNLDESKVVEALDVWKNNTAKMIRLDNLELLAWEGICSIKINQHSLTESVVLHKFVIFCFGSKLSRVF
jgi:hypothetical protein